MKGILYIQSFWKQSHMWRILQSLFVLCLAISHPTFGFDFIWDIDSSSNISTPVGVTRGNRGLPITKYSHGYNGNATNIYGGKGLMPHFVGTTVINGGLPQLGSIEDHITVYKRDIAALIPLTSYVGYCLIDYEWWRASWNETDPTTRSRSKELEGGNETAAKLSYENAARAFMLATIQATREVRPGCKVGWYGYPKTRLPFVPSPAYKKWCINNPGACWFEGYEVEKSASIQRLLNEEQLWLYEALDVITPSIYLGILPNNTTLEKNLMYINTSLAEALRISALARNHPPVMPYTWSFYNNYWETKMGPREPLTLADARAELLQPYLMGCKGLFLWGAIETTGDLSNTTQGFLGTQQWVDGVLSVVLKELTTIMQRRL
jgi:hypothetical protein